MAELKSERDNIISGGSALAGLAAGFGSVAVVAHDRGAAAMGVLFVAIGLFSILSTVGKLGTETAFVYFSGRLRGEGRLDRRTLIGLIQMGLGPVAVAAVAIGLALAAFADPLSSVLIDDANAATYATVLRVLAPFVPIWALTLPLLGITRGLGDVRPTAYGLQIAQPLLQLAFLAIAVYIGASIPWLAAAWAAPLLVTLAIAGGRVRAAIHLAPTPLPTASALDTAAPSAREFWGHAAPRGVAGTMSMAVERLGAILVGGLGTAELAGAWTAISRLAGICLRVVHAMSQALNTKLPALLGAGRQAAAMGQARLATWWTVALLTPVVTVATVFPETAMALFNAEDVPGAVSALRLAMVAVAVMVVLAHVDNVLLMSGRSTLVLLDTIPSLAILVGLSVVLVPSEGLPGAAVAWIVSVAVYRVLALFQVHQLFGTWILTPQVTLDTAAVAVVSTGIAIGVRRTLGEGLVMATAAGVAAGCLALAQLWRVRRRDKTSADPAGGRTESVTATQPALVGHGS